MGVETVRIGYSVQIADRMRMRSLVHSHHGRISGGVETAQKTSIVRDLKISTQQRENICASPGNFLRNSLTDWFREEPSKCSFSRRELVMAR